MIDPNFTDYRIVEGISKSESFIEMKRDPLIFILEILIYAFFAWQQEGVENN
jgi:hypothetical protein